MTDSSPESPGEQELLAWFESLSNWGRWGSDDRLGTLNFVTREGRQRAARLVRDGSRISCCWDLGAARDDSVQRFMTSTGEGLAEAERVQLDHPGIGPPGRFASASEYVGMSLHHMSVTHVDALSHIFWDGRMYNGLPASRVTSSLGATAHDITAAREGVFTRGVLLDIAAVQGRAWLDPGEGIYPTQLEAAEQQIGVRVGQGDALMIRTGYGRRKREQGPVPLQSGQPGLHAASLPWLREREVALVACDTALEVLPSGYRELILPVHTIGIAAMGLWTVDNCDFEQLAVACTALGRWEFLFTLDPLPIVGSTGSAVNPMATF